MDYGERIVSYTMDEILEMEDRTDHARLGAMRDEDIDYSDIPDHGDDEEFWARAIRLPRPEQGLFIRLDADVFEVVQGPGAGLSDADQRGLAQLCGAPEYGGLIFLRLGEWRVSGQ